MALLVIPKNIFKAYDIRGIYPAEINEDIVAKIARVLAGYFKSGSIVVGHDARLSSPSLYKSAVQNLARPGIKIMKVGLITSPMLSFLVNYFKAAGGLIITASHNPKEFNGLKVVAKKAIPISGKEIYELICRKNS